MTADVLSPSPEELRAWRSAALKRVGSSVEELESREEQSALTSDESNVLATVRSIDFLLDEDS